MQSIFPGGEYGDLFYRLKNTLENRKIVWSTFDTMSPWNGINSGFRVISEPLIYKYADGITKIVIPIGLGITINGIKVAKHYSPVVDISGHIVRFDIPYQPYIDNDNVEWFYHTLTGYGDWE